MGRGARPREKLLISKGFLNQSKAYWALFLTQYTVYQQIIIKETPK